MGPSQVVIATPDPRDVTATSLAVRRRGASPADLGETDAARWLGALGDDDEAMDAAFMLTITELPQLIRVPQGQIVLPRTLRFVMSAEAAPATRLLLRFDEEAQAEAFAARWPEIRIRLPASALPFAGFLDHLKLSQLGPEVELAGQLPEAQARMAFMMIRLVLQPASD